MLTTVGMPIVELGNIAVQTLIDRITKRHKIPMKIILPNTLLRRESVAVPNGYIEDYTI
jgi:DNA-binding LacI/PurR family transcriptional regulator